MGWYADDTSFCDQLVKIHNETPHKGEGIIGNFGVDKTRKESIDSSFFPDTLNWLEYGKVLQDCVDKYLTKYKYAKGQKLCINDLFNVQYYPPGGGYKMWHSERNDSSEINLTRHLVFMTYLNDVTGKDCEGGTEFFYQDVKIAAEKGLTLIWPSDWTHTHKGIVSENNEKYIVTGWIHLSKTNQFNLT